MEVLVAALKRTLHYQTQLNNSLEITLQLRIKVECLLISITLQAKFKILVPSNLAQLQNKHKLDKLISKIKEEMHQLEETVQLQQQRINKLSFHLSNHKLLKAKILVNVVAYNLLHDLLLTCKQKHNPTYLFTKLISVKVKFTKDQIFHLTKLPNFNSLKYNILLSSSKFIYSNRSRLNIKLLKSKVQLLKQQLNF